MKKIPVNLEEKGHAKLSASGSSRWLNCPGSIEAEQLIDDLERENNERLIAEGKEPLVKENEPAKLGTLAHELADVCLKNELDAHHYINTNISVKYEGEIIETTIDEEMVKYIQEYLDYTRSFETGNCQIYNEEKVDFSNLVPDGFGTLDRAILDYDNGICHIFDLKYGKAIVKAENNTQGKMYALGLYNELNFLDSIKSFKIHIVQPRAYSITSWDISVKDLIAFGEEVRKKAKLALKKDAPRIAGEPQCTWCKARFTCPALYKLTYDSVSDDFEDLGQKKFNKLKDDKKDKFNVIPADRIKLILDNKKLITKFLENVEAYALETMLKGDKIEGYKLVKANPHRRWNDQAEEFIVSKVGEDSAYNKNIISITDAKKLLDKEDIEKLTYKPEGAITIAPETDKRSEVKPTIGEFKNLNN